MLRAIANRLNAARVWFTQSGTGLSATTVQAAIVELDTNIDAHIADASAAHAASAIAFTPAGSIAATDVQAAVVEIDGDVTAHVTDSAGAHAASAISFTPAGTIAATTVQAAIEEVASEATGISASTVDAKGDLLVGTAADTVGRLAVGTDGYVLAAASGEAPGLQWQEKAASDTAAGFIEIATQAEQETGTDTTRAVTPGRQHYHPSAAKAWVRFSGDGATVNGSYGVSSVTDTAAGLWTVNFTTAFSSVGYAVTSTSIRSAQQLPMTPVVAGTTSCSFEVVNSAFSANADSGGNFAAFHGDQ